MSADITEWLQGIGLGEYAQVFIENDIDVTLLPELDDVDLEKIGVVSLGHRRRILKEVREQSEDAAQDTNRTRAPAEFGEGQKRDAERRQLTVMFCDMVGSTVLSQRLDPEDFRDVIRRYQDSVAGAVTRYGGHVAKYLGDGVLAYFGWPQSYEDQAERAVRAGRDAVEAVAAISIASEKALSARAGISTGQVVVGDLVGESGLDPNAVVGDTPNLAARLQQIADPGEVIVGDLTHRLLGGAFLSDDLGSQTLKGFDDEIRAWRITSESHSESRFAAAHESGPTPLIGRNSELDLLRDRWALSTDGEGQVVLISGEPGIGKSRLLQALGDEVSGQVHTRLRYQCSPHHANRPFHPIIRQLENAAHFHAGDAPEEKLRKLSAIVGDARVGEDDVTILFADMLQVPVEAQHGLPGLSPRQKKDRTIEALIAQLGSLSQERPVLFLFEDAHWIDPTTQDLLEQTAPRIAGWPIMMVITHRPEWHGRIASQPNATTIALNRLGHKASIDLVRAVSGTGAADDFILQVVNRADGVPLYAEEIAKSALEAGGGDQGIPDSLQASLMARLDRLGDAKAVAQVAAAIGREFTYQLVEAVAGLPPADLAASLQALVDSGLVFGQGSPPEASYIFKHALVQDTAYSSLLMSSRKTLNRRIADVLLSNRDVYVDVGAEITAHHLAEAGDLLPAAHHWLAAARSAIGAAANEEAIAYLERALNDLEQAPQDEERDTLALDCLIALGGANIASGGYAAEGTIAAYRKGGDLIKRLPYDSRHASVLYGNFVSTYNLGDIPASAPIATELLELADRQKDDEARCVALRSLAVAYNPMGRFEDALSHASDAWALYDRERHRDSGFRYGHDIGVAAVSHMVIAHQMLGDLDKASKLSDMTMALAEDINHPASVAYALLWFGTAKLFRRSVSMVSGIADRLVSYTEERGMEAFLAWGYLFQGAARAMEGENPAEALRNLEHSSGIFARSRTRVFRQAQAAATAEAFIHLDATDQAAAAIDRGFSEGVEIGEAWLTPELHRLRALTLSTPAEKMSELEAGLDVARRQGNLLHELRCAHDLAATLRDQQGDAVARAVLSPVYDRFVEGFDAWDLARARALLDALR